MLRFFPIPTFSNLCFAFIQSFAQRHGATHQLLNKVGHVIPREVWRGTAQLSPRYYGTCPPPPFFALADSVTFGNSLPSCGLAFRGGLHG